MTKDIQHIIEQFRAERLSQGLSSKTITGNEGKGVYRLEQGQAIPKLDTFKKWCDILGLEIKLVKK